MSNLGTAEADRTFGGGARFIDYFLEYTSRYFQDTTLFTNILRIGT
jgi:hypothetical protein